MEDTRPFYGMSKTVSTMEPLNPGKMVRQPAINIL